MFNAEICFFSPLCIKTVNEGHHPALLLQFILTELFCINQEVEDSISMTSNSSSRFYLFPYDWSQKIHRFVKIQEHAKLLEHAFPALIHEAEAFNKAINRSKKQISRYLKNLYESLEPFLIACNTNENLLLFLCKSKRELSELFSSDFEVMLKRINIDTSSVVDIIEKEYENRGFHFTISEIEPLTS